VWFVLDATCAASTACRTVKEENNLRKKSVSALDMKGILHKNPFVLAIRVPVRSEGTFMIRKSAGRLGRTRVRKLSVLATAALAGGAFVAPGINPAAAAPSGALYSAGRYLVTFSDDAVASYDGYQKGFPATRPAKGNKLNPNANTVKQWQQHLQSRHDAALAAVGATKIYDYTLANNGVAANLSGRQAAEIAKQPGVMSVEKDKLYQLDTTDSPHFLGLDQKRGLWNQLGGQKNAGAGVVVGVIDSGIWPETPPSQVTPVLRCPPTGTERVSRVRTSPLRTATTS